MPRIESSAPGHFCWIELATTDAHAAKSFYTRLLGWSVVEHDMGEMGKYYIFQKDGRDAAAMYNQDAKQREMGIPPNWASYVAVASADDSVSRAQSLGATVHVGPFDVNDLGRMAVLQDPQGAVFCVWQANKSVGLTIRNEVNTLCWNELATRDAAASLQFYSKLFGWNGKVSPEYTEIDAGGTPIGGMRTLHETEQTPPYWMPYFDVENCDAFASAAQGAGGRIYVQPTDIPNAGRFSVMADPQGAVFAVIQPTAR